MVVMRGGVFCAGGCTCGGMCRGMCLIHVQLSVNVSGFRAC